MSLNFLIFFAYYFVILISIIGYGYILLSFEKIKKNFLDLSYVGLIGIFFLIIYSYSSNLLIPHSKIHNIVFIIIGFLVFFIFFKNIHKIFFLKKI